MVKEQVIVKQIAINKVNQVVDFQMKLPTDAKKVVGIETGISVIAPLLHIELNPVIPTQGLLMPFNRQRLFGELTLQSFEASNVFYSTQVKVENNEIMGDYTTNNFFQPKPYVLQSLLEPDPISICGTSTIIRCIYKNLLPENEHHELNYQLRIYLWLEIGKVEKKQQCACNCMNQPMKCSCSNACIQTPNTITSNS